MYTFKILSNNCKKMLLSNFEGNNNISSGEPSTNDTPERIKEELGLTEELKRGILISNEKDYIEIIQQIKKLLAPETIFFSYDEIREIVGTEIGMFMLELDDTEKFIRIYGITNQEGNEIQFSFPIEGGISGIIEVTRDGVDMNIGY